MICLLIKSKIIIRNYKTKYFNIVIILFFYNSVNVQINFYSDPIHEFPITNKWLVYNNTKIIKNKLKIQSENERLKHFLFIFEVNFVFKIIQ